MLDDTTSEPKRRAPLAVWLARCQTAPFPQFSCDRDGKKIYFEIIFDFKREIIIAKQAGFPLGGVSGRFNHREKMSAQSWRNLFSGTP